MKPGPRAVVNIAHEALGRFVPVPLARARFHGIDTDGAMLVWSDDRTLATCDVLESLDIRSWQPGERVLMALTGEGERPVVVGRIVPRPAPAVPSNVTIEATDTLTLKCGDASVDLRADGKVMVRGDDVLLRAKGTQRIRAGHVAIN